MTEFQVEGEIRRALDVMTDCLPQMGLFQEATNGGRGMTRVEYRGPWVHPRVIQRVAKVITESEQELRMLLVDTTISLERLAFLSDTQIERGKVVNQSYCVPHDPFAEETPSRYIALLTNREFEKYTSVGRARWVTANVHDERPLTAEEMLHLIRQDTASVAHKSFRVFGSRIGSRELLLRPNSDRKSWRLSLPMPTTGKYGEVIKVYNNTVRSYFARLTDVISVT